MKDWSGSVATSASIALPMLLAVGGLATDYSVFSSNMTSLQSAADASALAAVKELALANQSDKSIISAAEAFARSSVAETLDDVSIGVTVDRDSGTVKVELSANWQPTFAHFVGLASTPIDVSATARLTGENSNICVLATDPTANKAIELKNKAGIEAKNCGVFANSEAKDSISLHDSATITAASTCARGGIDALAGSISPAPLTDCPVVEDPLSDRMESIVTDQNQSKLKAESACDFTDYVFTEGTVTLHPGTYCGGISASKTAEITLSSGIYVLKGGSLCLKNGAKLYGRNVVIALREGASLEFNDNSIVDLEGMEEGTYAGLLFADESLPGEAGEHKISSTNASNMTGTIYLPNSDLVIDPDAKVAQASAYTAIIVKTLRLYGGPDLILNSNYGATNVPVPDGIKAQLQVVLVD